MTNVQLYIVIGLPTLAGDIRALARIAEIHRERRTRLEG